MSAEKVRENAIPFHGLYPRIQDAFDIEECGKQAAYFVSCGRKTNTCSGCGGGVTKRKWRLFVPPELGFIEYMVILCVPCYQTFLKWEPQEKTRDRAAWAALRSRYVAWLRKNANPDGLDGEPLQTLLDRGRRHYGDFR